MAAVRGLALLNGAGPDTEALAERTLEALEDYPATVRGPLPLRPGGRSDGRWQVPEDVARFYLAKTGFAASDRRVCVLVALQPLLCRLCLRQCHQLVFL